MKTGAMKKNLCVCMVGAMLFCGIALGHLRKAQPINILTWWGYLNYPEITQYVEHKCNVRLSYDEYYSNTEFLRRWEDQKHNYDIVIFSDTIFKVIEKEIALKNSPLWQQSFQYNPIVRKHYKANHFPSNVVFFVHTLTGFLWNPEVISLSKNDSVYAMFQKAKNKLVVIIDDPVEARKLISLGYYKKRKGTRRYKLVPLTLKNFKELVQGSQVYITNNYSKIYRKKNFAFAFDWGGEAIVNLKNAKRNYKFLVHPDLSYISSDLLANLNNHQATVCTAKALTSKKVMTILQNKDYYFSPYVDDSKVTDPIFKNLYEKFIHGLPYLQWTQSMTRKNFNSLGRTWDIIRLEVNR